jgi:hypothetical protein
MISNDDGSGEKALTKRHPRLQSSGRSVGVLLEIVAIAVVFASLLLQDPAGVIRAVGCAN